MVLRKLVVGLLPVIGIWIAVMGWLQPTLENGLKVKLKQALTSRSDAQWASVTVAGRDVIVSGAAQDAAHRDAIIASLGAIPGLRRVDDRTMIAPPAPAPGAAGTAAGTEAGSAPFVWSAVRIGNEVRLHGNIPSGAVRRSVLEQLAGLLPGTVISDRMLEQASPSPMFAQGAEMALRHLARLESGTVQLIGDAYTLRGMVSGERVRASIAADLSTLPAGLRLGVVEIAVAEPRRFTWSAERNGTQIVLSGGVGSAAIRQKLWVAVATAIPQSVIADRQVVVEGAPASAGAAAERSILLLAQLAYGSVVVADDGVSVSGQPIDAAAAARLQADAQTWPAGIKLTQIDLLRAPEPRLESVVAPALRAATASPLPGSPADCRESVATLAQRLRVEFEPERVTLTPANRAELIDLAVKMVQCPRARVVIAGHGDPAHGEKKDIQKDSELARRRAITVAELLLRSGVERDRLIVSNRPVSPGIGGGRQTNAN